MIKRTLYILIVLIGINLFPKISLATTFFVDMTAGNVTNCGSAAGTATTTAFCTIDQFAEVARSADDVAFVRRGNATTTQSTSMADLNPLSAGTLNAPIIISADDDNMWNDDATTTETYTPTFGSKFMASSASSTLAFKGNWIFVAGDCNQNYNATWRNPCDYFYEIASSTADGLSLYLPYKGNQSGAGLKLRVMQTAPKWGVPATTNQWTPTASGWYIQGININSTNASCAITTSGASLTFSDMFLQGDGITDCGLTSSNNYPFIFHLRTLGQLTGTGQIRGGEYRDFLIDCNNVVSSFGFGTQILEINKFYDGEVKNCTRFAATGSGINTEAYFRNVKRNQIYTNISGGAYTRLYFEDDFGTVGLSSQSTNQISSLIIATTTQATTTNIMTGPVNTIVYPPLGTGNTGLSTRQWPQTYIKVFEYPIYANTSSKTYSIGMLSTSTSSWTANPLTTTATGSTTPELFLQCEYYGDSTTATRMRKRSSVSNGTINFTGSTAKQTLSITCQPSQTGILYLSLWYGKPLETSKNNWFFVDGTPTIQ